MQQIVLDFGSGNTCKNNTQYIQQMYDSLKEIDKGKHEIIIKWQLFKVAGPNVPLSLESFDFAYDYGTKLGYKVTSSVFDNKSLEFLLNYKIPFIKLSNNRMLDFLIDGIPEEVPLYISKTEPIFWTKKRKFTEELWCVSQYPASFRSYNSLDMKENCNISDHTENFDIFNKYKPKIIEWHYKLDYSTGLDSGSFARTPNVLKEIL